MIYARVCGGKLKVYRLLGIGYWVLVIGYWVLDIGKGDKKKRARYHIELLTHYEKHYLLITQLLAQNTIYKYRAKA